MNNSVQAVLNTEQQIEAPLQLLAASKATKSAGPWKASRATPAEKGSPTFRASNFFTGKGLDLGGGGAFKGAAAVAE